MKKWHTYAVNKAKGHLTFNQMVAGSIPARPTIESTLTPLLAKCVVLLNRNCPNELTILLKMLGIPMRKF